MWTCWGWQWGHKLDYYNENHPNEHDEDVKHESDYHDENYPNEHDDDGGDPQDRWQRWSATNLPWNKCGSYLDLDLDLDLYQHFY